MAVSTVGRKLPNSSSTNSSSARMRDDKVRVSICGGGIGGLCLAVLLSRLPNICVQLYEATAQFKEIGAGVVVWSRTWHIMNHMGLAEELAKCAHSPPTGETDIAFDFRKSDQSTEGFSFQVLEIPYGCIRFHRAEFLDVLVRHLPDGIAHFKKRLVSYQVSHPKGLGPISVTFADGSSDTCDVLIGADGIKSAIRAQMYRQSAQETGDVELLKYVDPIWTGRIAYRGLIPVNKLKTASAAPHRVTKNPMMYCGKDKHIVSYLISRGDIVNVSTSVSQPERNGEKYDGEWVNDCTHEELLGAYSGWEPEALELLKCIDKPTKWALHQLLPLPFYVKDGVALLGDAAHAMSPHQGAGAGQAIEDAFILAGLLADATKETLHQLLGAYESVRLPASQRVMKYSHENGLMYEFNSTHGENYATLGPALTERWRWLEETTIGDALEEAIHVSRTSSPTRASHT